MKEAFLHFIWKFGLYNKQLLTTTDNESIQIISHGTSNSLAGPDFQHAKIKIADTLWVGNVEIHIHSSDWYKHQHHTDPAYDNVVLHVVLHAEPTKTISNSGYSIPCLLLQFPETLFLRYQSLMASVNAIPCTSLLPKIDKIHLQSWLTRLASERLERKCNDINTLLMHHQNDWKSCFYQLLFKYFGLKANATPFEVLFISLPISCLSKGLSTFQLEALLFGQSGLLTNCDDLPNDTYQDELIKEYTYQKNKYQLKTPEDGHWKWGGLRPSNFPTIRIAQLAQLLSRDNLIELVLQAQSTKDLMDILNVTASTYWDTHYSFGKETPSEPKRIGTAMRLGILNNVFIPFLFAYHQHNALVDGADDLNDLFFDFLEQLPSENNHIIKEWKSVGIQAKNALEGQALLQLKSEYCDNKRCLHCAIGKYVIDSERK